MNTSPETQPTAKPPVKRSNWIMRWRYWLRPMLSKRGTPEAIALGFAIGFVVAFTPTIGFQLLLAYFVATLFKANRPAALIPVWITSPVTIPPIYAFTYTIGKLFVDGPSVGHVRRQLTDIARQLDRHALLDIGAHLKEFLRVGQDVFIPMMLGGLIVGGACAAVAYPTVLWAVRRYRAHRERVRVKRRGHKIWKRKKSGEP